MQPVLAAEPPDVAGPFAIRGARVVTVSGETIDHGTLVVARGLIEAVGPDAEIEPPTGAWLIDGDGLVVYPGLIDGLAALPLTAPAPPTGQEAPQSRGPEDRPGTTPWLKAADFVDAEGVAKWREAGFAAAVVAPRDGLVPGQAALVNLSGVDADPARGAVLRDRVALRLEPRVGQSTWRGFPNSLMGAHAYLRQLFLDARHFRDATRRYEEDPRGLARPAYERALAPLAELIDAATPVLLPAQSADEIARAIELAAALEMRPILVGAHEGFQASRALATSRVPVLVSLAWPAAAKEPDPQAKEPLRALRLRARAPETPEALRRAGVRFAFCTEALETPATALAAVRQAIDAGLPREAAVRALTLDAAEVFGLADRLGSLEPGKIANLLIARGELFADGTRLDRVVIDGRVFAMDQAQRDDAAPAGEPSSQPSEAAPSASPEQPLPEPASPERPTLEVPSVDEPPPTAAAHAASAAGAAAAPAGETVPPGEGEDASPVVKAAPLGTEAEAIANAPPAGLEPAAGEGIAEAEAKAQAIESAAEDAAAGAAASEPSHAPPAPAEPTRVVLVRNAHVLTVSGEPIETGEILVRDGRIAAVGRNLRAPPRALVIDAGGGYVTPGIVDCHSHIAIAGGVNESSVAVSSMTAIEHVLDPSDPSIYRALAGGVTTANVLHGSANPIGGTNAVIKLRWGKDARGLLFEGAPPGIKLAMGENPKRSGSTAQPGQDRRYPATRMGVLDVVRETFLEARAYQAEWRRYEAERKKSRRDPIPPRRDLRLEPLVEVLEGERLVHAHSYRADEILQLLRLAEELGFRIATLQHVLEGYRVADEIAAHGAGASTFSDRWAYKIEAWEAIPHNAALMTERGVLVSINSDSAEEMRHLNQEAAKAMKWGGLSESEALRLVTLNPAIQLGIDDRVGSIERGKDADLVIWDRHPLSAFAVVQTTLVDGEVYFDRARDRALRDELAAERRTLEKQLKRESLPDPENPEPIHRDREPTGGQP